MNPSSSLSVPAPVVEPHACRICGHAGAATTYTVPELQYGTRELFRYFLCAGCGCLQLVDIPEDLGRYYPGQYYSYLPVGGGSAWRRFKDRLEWKRDRFAFTGRGLIGRFFQAALPENALPKLRHIAPAPSARILDVGSGAGRFMHFLAEEGYRNVTGVDPFVGEAKEYPNGLRILKQDFMTLQGKWDVVMFNHSLEHIPDNLAGLRKARELLADDGVCIVEIPTVDSLAWERYGIYWNSLDAPRHIYLHSLRSFRLLAEQAGFRVQDTLFVSHAAQFWGSENYVKGFTHRASPGRLAGILNRLYRATTFLAHHLRAKRANRQSRGDAVAFFLRKA